MNTISCSLMMVTVVPLQNMVIKVIRKFLVYIFLNKILSTVFIFICTRFKFDSMNFFNWMWSLKSVNGSPLTAMWCALSRGFFNTVSSFSCSLIASVCPSVVAWSYNADILTLILPFINDKFAIGTSFSFSSWPVKTLYMIFFSLTTSIIFSLLNRSFHFIKVVSFGILLLDIFISYHLSSSLQSSLTGIRHFLESEFCSTLAIEQLHSL